MDLPGLCVHREWVAFFFAGRGLDEVDIDSGGSERSRNPETIALSPALRGEGGVRGPGCARNIGRAAGSFQDRTPHPFPSPCKAGARAIVSGFVRLRSATEVNLRIDSADTTACERPGWDRTQQKLADQHRPACIVNANVSSARGEPSGCANGFWHCLHCSFVFALKGRHRRARGNAPGCPKRPKPQP